MSPAVAPAIVAWIAAAPEVDAGARAALLPAVQASALRDGSIVLATCHRVERFAIDDGGAAPPAMLELRGAAAARHVIRVALGLESAVVGEDQVLHQLRAAVTDARRRDPVRGDLGLLLDRALQAGRTGRSWRPAIATSLGERAIDLVDARLGPSERRRILVVGAGPMGRLAATTARRRGATVTVASRDPEHAATVASTLGAGTTSFDPGADGLAAFDAVIVALAGRWTLGTRSLAVLASRSLVIDLSMPPALDAATRMALGPRGIDIDALHADGPIDPAIARYRTRLEALAERTLDGYLVTLAARRHSRADRLAARIEGERAAALAAYLRTRPGLDGAARTELEALSRAISARLFREPLARLATDPDGRRGRALDELFEA